MADQEQYRKQYEASKEQVLTFLDDATPLLVKLGEIEKPLQDLRHNVAESLFSIVMVGEFSAGKSTLLNALMRRRVLPSFASETTATVNFLCHTSRSQHGEAGVVHYRDGSKDEIPELTLETIEQVVSTKGMRNGQTIAESVEHVDLFLDSPFLENGVMLVDSPGLNGVAEGHREITEQQIKASHAGIFLFSADRPGSKTDFEFLRNLKKQSNNVFLVLNKIDVLKKSENETVESVIEGLKANYRKIFPDEGETLPEFWPVSGIAALAARDPENTEFRPGEKATSDARQKELEAASRMEAFESRLWKYLTQGERTREQLSSPVEKVTALLNEHRKTLEKTLELMENEGGTEALLQEKEHLEETISQLQKEKRENSKELITLVSGALQGIRESLGARCNGAKQEIRRRSEECETTEDLRSYVETIPDMFNRRMQGIVAGLDDEIRQELLKVTQLAYEAHFGELSSRLHEAGGLNTDRVFSNATLDVSHITVNAGLAQYEAWKEEKEAEIKKLRTKRNELEESSLSARRMESKIRESEAALQSIQDRKYYFMDNFAIPEAVRYTTTESTPRWRGGLFGAIANLFVGRKYDQTEETHWDTRAQDAARQERDMRLEAFDNQEQRAREQLQMLKRPEKDSEELDFLANRQQRALDEAEETYRQEREKFLKNLEMKDEKAMRRIALTRDCYLDDATEEAQRMISDMIHQQESRYVEMVQDILNIAINQKLKREEDAREELLATISAEGEERDRKLAEARDANEKLQTLIERGVQLTITLQQEMQDTIEEEVL